MLEENVGGNSSEVHSLGRYSADGYRRPGVQGRQGSTERSCTQLCAPVKTATDLKCYNPVQLTTYRSAWLQLFLETTKL